MMMMMTMMVIIEHVPKQNFNCSLKVFIKIIRKVGFHGDSPSSTYWQSVSISLPEGLFYLFIFLGGIGVEI